VRVSIIRSWLNFKFLPSRWTGDDRLLQRMQILTTTVLFVGSFERWRNGERLSSESDIPFSVFWIIRHAWIMTGRVGKEWVHRTILWWNSNSKSHIQNRWRIKWTSMKKSFLYAPLYVQKLCEFSKLFNLSKKIEQALYFWNLWV